MIVNVKLSEDLVAKAKYCAQMQNRSLSEQIEYWALIGRIVEENPDLPFSIIRDILIADREKSVDEYQFS